MAQFQVRLRGEFEGTPAAARVGRDIFGREALLNGAVLQTYRRPSPGISAPDVNPAGDFSVSRSRARRRVPAGQCAERERRLQMRGLSSPQVPTGSAGGGGEGGIFRHPRRLLPALQLRALR